MSRAISRMAIGFYAGTLRGPLLQSVDWVHVPCPSGLARNLDRRCCVAPEVSLSLAHSGLRTASTVLGVRPWVGRRRHGAISALHFKYVPSKQEKERYVAFLAFTSMVSMDSFLWQ